jgi:hypothetical protein
LLMGVTEQKREAPASLERLRSLDSNQEPIG